MASHTPATLTDRERRFVEAYLLNPDATKAAIAAGYSPRGAASTGHDVLHRPRVSEAIAKEMEERARRTRIDADALLTRLAEEADADVADIFEDDGRLKPVHEWPKVWRKGLVAGIEVEQLYEGTGKDRVAVGTLAKIRLSDRTKRLELIGRHVGVQAFRDKVSHDVEQPLKDLLAELKGRGIRPGQEPPANPSAPGIIRPREE
ncbi:hypothetical protein [Microcystis phage Mwe-JY25]